MALAHLKPAVPGLRITYPGTRVPLPAEGAQVELTSYWHERIRDGSVQVVEPRNEPEHKPAEEPRKAAIARPAPKKD